MPRCETRPVSCRRPSAGVPGDETPQNAHHGARLKCANRGGGICSGERGYIWTAGVFPPPRETVLAPPVRQRCALLERRPAGRGGRAGDVRQGWSEPRIRRAAFFSLFPWIARWSRVVSASGVALKGLERLGLARARGGTVSQAPGGVNSRAEANQKSAGRDSPARASRRARGAKQGRSGAHARLITEEPLGRDRSVPQLGGNQPPSPTYGAHPSSRHRRWDLFLAGERRTLRGRVTRWLELGPWGPQPTTRGWTGGEWLTIRSSGGIEQPQAARSSLHRTPGIQRPVAGDS